MIKPRNPLIHWVLVLITGGLYAFVWVHRIAADTNRLTGLTIVSIRKSLAATFLLIGAYLSVFTVGVVQFQRQMDALRAGADVHPTPGPLLFVGIALGMALMVHLCRILLKSAAALKTHRGIDVPKPLILLLLTIFYFISLPLLQSKLNALTVARP